MVASVASRGVSLAWPAAGRVWRWPASVLPGVALCLGVTALATVAQAVETWLFGRAWLEALVLAILIGTAARTGWTPAPRWRAGIAFSAKTLLEVAMLLLGAAVSTRALMAAGPALLLGIAGVVVLAIGASYGLGRLLGLRHRMAVLVACGNSICGNSAIAAVAPVIGAGGEDVAAAIAFTAVLGVIVVLVLPFMAPLLHLSELRYGALAGLTIYAVPQVLAATAPVGPLAVQFGTLVKLVRVLMLAPVVLTLSLLTARRGARSGARSGAGVPARRVRLGHMVPWFIVGFLLLAGARAAGMVPAGALGPTAAVANLLTVVAMAALGLGTDLRMMARSGPRVSIAVTLSLLALIGLSLGLIRLLGLA